MALPPFLPNWDYLQRGYDVIYIDPTTLAEVDKRASDCRISLWVRQYVFDMQPSVPLARDSNYSMPPECDSSFPYTFQSQSTTDIIQVSSDIAEATSSSISFSASDPTGQLWSCSGSSATAARRQVDLQMPAIPTVVLTPAISSIL